MKYNEFHLNNFSHGYDSTSSPEKLPDNSMGVGSTNVSLTTEGAVTKRNGYRKAISDAGASWSTHTETLGLHQFNEPGNTRRLVRIARNPTGGDVRVENNAATLPQIVSTWVAGVSLLTADSATSVGSAEQFCQFASYVGRLYVACPGLNDLHYLTYSGGFADTAIGTTGSTRTLQNPEGVELWYDRIWTYMDRGTERGSFLLYSNIDGDSFNLDDDWQEIPGDGHITGIVRVDRRLIVFKPRETYILSGGEDPVSLLRVDQLSRDVGCIAPRSIVSVGNDIYFMSERGAYWTNGNQLTYLGENIEADISDLDRTALKNIHGIHNRQDSQVSWWIPKAEGQGDGYGLPSYGTSGYGAGSIVNRCYTYDYKNQGWCSPYSNVNFLTSCLYVNNTSTATDDEEIIIVGGLLSDNDNHIFQWNYGTQDGGDGDTDGTVVNAQAFTKPFDFGDPALIKIVRKVYTQVGEQGSSTPLRVSLYDTYGSPLTADTSGTQKTTAGSMDAPVYTETRHTVGCRSKHVIFSFADYDDGTDDGGPWILVGVVALFSTKGRRS